MHELGFIIIFGDGYRNIEGVRAVIHLLAGDFENFIPIFFEEQALELSAALRITTLADD